MPFGQLVEYGNEGLMTSRIHAGVGTVANRALHAYAASGLGPYISHRPQFTHRVSLTTIKSALQFWTAVLVDVYTSGAPTQVIVPSEIVPTPATVEDCVHVGAELPVVHVPEHDDTL